MALGSVRTLTLTIMHPLPSLQCNNLPCATPLAGPAISRPLTRFSSHIFLCCRVHFLLGSLSRGGYPHIPAPTHSAVATPGHPSSVYQLKSCTQNTWCLTDPISTQLQPGHHRIGSDGDGASAFHGQLHQQSRQAPDGAGSPGRAQWMVPVRYSARAQRRTC